MPTLTDPRIDPDGSHVIPLTGIHRPGGAPNEYSTGEIRWSRRDGITFWFQTPLTTSSDIPETDSSNRGAGSVQSFTFEPDWLAKTADGFDVRIRTSSSEITWNDTSYWGVFTGSGSESSKRIEGSASSVELTLHRDNPLAFWYDTPLGHRLYSPGWGLREWPVHEPIEFKIQKLTHTRTRCSLQLDGPGNRRLFAAFGELNRPLGTWLTYHPDEKANPFRFPESCDRFRGLMSILLGRRIPFVWRDTPLSNDRLKRLYYGWIKGVDHAHPDTLLVPLYGSVDSFTHGKEVAERFDKLDQRFADLRETFNPEWVLSPLWTAAEDFVDNKLALACVALERLASAYHKFVRPTGRYASQPALMDSNQKKALLSALRKVLSQVADSEKLTIDTSKILDDRFNDLFKPTNADRLRMVFEELGIPLGKVERDVIKKRNLCMHGNPSLKDGQHDEELRHFDILRTLIGRAILHLLDYDGPYIDYSARPVSGNFPICICSPPPKQAQT